MDNQNEATMRLIMKLANAARRHADMTLFDGNLSGAEARVLHFLFLCGDTPVYQKDIQKEFGMRAPSVSQLIDHMEKDGLIERKLVGTDRRLKQIVLTDKAAKSEEIIKKRIEEVNALASEGITAEEMAEFNKTGEKILKNIS